MSREQLVDAYLRGEISRRMFVRRLVALGVSLGAAVTYAEVMPARAIASSSTNQYPALADHTETAPNASPSSPSPPDHDTTPPKIGLTTGAARRSALAAGQALAIQVTLSEPGSVNVTVFIRKLNGGQVTLNLPRGGSAHSSLRLNRAGRKAVAKASSLTVVAHALDNAGNPARKAITVALS